MPCSPPGLKLDLKGRGAEPHKMRKRADARLQDLTLLATRISCFVLAFSMLFLHPFESAPPAERYEQYKRQFQ
jgi:hypothetical protein